jgi:hypothetical protein
MMVATAIHVGINLLYAALMLALHFYMRRLDAAGCGCATRVEDAGKRVYISAFLLLRATAAVASCVPRLAPAAQAALQAVLLPFDVVFVVLALQYVDDLKTRRCACSAELGGRFGNRDVLQAVAVVDALFIALVTLMLASTAFLAVQQRAARRPGPL